MIHYTHYTLTSLLPFLRLCGLGADLAPADHPRDHRVCRKAAGVRVEQGAARAQGSADGRDHVRHHACTPMPPDAV